MVGNLYRQTVRFKAAAVASLLAWKTQSPLPRRAPGPHPAEFGVLRTDLGEGVGYREPGPANAWTPAPWGSAPRPGPLTTEL